MEDLDGEPIAEDLDGEPMDDLDGEPLAYDVKLEFSKEEKESKMIFKNTSWSQVFKKIILR